jgi:hypothetical protein
MQDEDPELAAPTQPSVAEAETSTRTKSARSQFWRRSDPRTVHALAIMIETKSGCPGPCVEDVKSTPYKLFYATTVRDSSGHLCHGSKDQTDMP